MPPYLILGVVYYTLVFLPRQCAEFISLATSAWSRGVLEKALSLLEELIRKGLKDADAQARKHMRRYSTHSSNVI